MKKQQSATFVNDLLYLLKRSNISKLEIITIVQVIIEVMRITM